MNWISVEERLPPEGIRIKIKAHYKQKNIPEAVAIFYVEEIDEHTEAWKWVLDKSNQEAYGTLRPTHWMPLPEVPSELD